jgi:hypothetical protein
MKRNQINSLIITTNHHFTNFNANFLYCRLFIALNLLEILSQAIILLRTQEESNSKHLHREDQINH